MAQKWSDEDIEAAVARARNAYHEASAVNPSPASAPWRAAVLAVLDELFEQDDYFDTHPDVRDFLADDAEEVRWAGEDKVEVGEGASMCSARRGENPNWVLQHAANALMLYRVLKGEEPWPTDPKAVERSRMAQTLYDEGSVAHLQGPEELAKTLQRLGFTLPERPAA